MRFGSSEGCATPGTSATPSPKTVEQHRLRDAQPVTHGRQHDDAHEQGAEQQQLTHRDLLLTGAQSVSRRD